MGKIIERVRVRRRAERTRQLRAKIRGERDEQWRHFEHGDSVAAADAARNMAADPLHWHWRFNLLAAITVVGLLVAGFIAVFKIS